MLQRYKALLGAGAFVGLMAGAPAQATYPDHPIRLIVPFSPGSAADNSMRRIAPGLARALGQPVTVENRAGAAGIIGSAAAAKAPADGYTLLAGTVSTHALNVGTYKSLPYDPERDFTPISRTNAFPNVLVVSPRLGVATVAEFLALARRADPPLSYASGGSGTTPHLAGALLARNAGLRLLHVPYKDTSTYMQDVIAGRVDMVFLAAGSVAELARAGKVRALAVASAQRTALLPDVPTTQEAGLPGLDLSIWVGLFAPRGTPPAVVDALNRAVRAALTDPAIRDGLAASGSVPEPDATPGDFAAFLHRDIERWVTLAREAGVEPQ